MHYIINLGSMFFLVSLIWNLAYIDYSLCHIIWSVYMQYLQCCDHSKKMLVPRCSTDWSVANLFLVSVYINNLNDSRHYFVTGPSPLFCMGVCVIILSNVFPVHSLHKRFRILILIRGYEIKHIRMYVIFVNFHGASILNLGKHGTHLAFSYTGRFALFLRIHCERIPLLFLHTIYWLTANHTLLVKRVVIFLNFRR